MRKEPHSTIIVTAVYIGPPSRGFYPNRPYRLKVKGDRVIATEIFQMPSLGDEVGLRNEYSLGGFLANWKDIKVEHVYG